MNTIYLRMRHRVKVTPKHWITIGDIAKVIAGKDIRDQVIDLPIYYVTEQDSTYTVIDVMQVIKKLHLTYSDYEVQSIGAAQAILELRSEKRILSFVYLVLVWFLLFIGASLAIMNFHEDVSMQEVHQHLFEMVTGNYTAKPLLLQIPYSIGLGVGMILFFNHLFRKRLNEEPSPLEIEMFNYQQDLDQYLIMEENKESKQE